MAVALALTASVLYGVSNYVGPTLSRRAPLFLVIVCGQAVALVSSAALAAATGSAFLDAGQVGAALAAGTGNAIGLLAFYRAAQLGPLSIVTPIGALGAAVPVTAGLVSGETATLGSLLGIGLALGGVVLATGGSGESDQPDQSAGPCAAAPVPDAVGETQRTGGFVSRACVGWSLLAALAFGMFLAALAPAAEGGVLWAVFVSRISLLAIVLACGIVLRQELRAPARTLPLLAVPGLLLFCGTLAYAGATTEGDLSVVSVVGSLFPVVTVTLAFALGGERLSRLQAAGVSAALLGVVLLSAQ